VFGLKPKIPGMCFLSTLRYVLKLPELGTDIPELTIGENYYAILSLFRITKNNQDWTDYCLASAIIFSEALHLH
jgi:hypothetical protein